MLKFSIAILLSLLALVYTQSADDAKREERVFNQWLKKYNLDVAENADFNAWKAEVIRKYKSLADHNEKYRRGERKFKKALNNLSHLTSEQRQATLLGFTVRPNATKSSERATLGKIDPSLVKDFPSYFNWEDEGIIKPAGNQNPCGSCYVFASIAVIEAHACRLADMCEKLSEQEGLDCVQTGRPGCKGGHDQDVYDYSVRSGGATYGKDYKYIATPQTCDTSARPRAPKTKVLDYKWMPYGGDEPTIRYYLKIAGPMFLAMDWYESFEGYDGGIFDDASGKVIGGHAITLTGWGTENGTDYWILRNSWGPDWGEKGYFRILRGVNFANSESYQPSYPILDL